MLRREYKKIHYFFSTNLCIKKNDNDETIIYRLKFIDSFRFLSASLSSLVDNLSEIYKKECGLIGLKNNELYIKSKKCTNELYESINRLIKKFHNTYRFFNEDVHNFVLLLKKGVYPYEYMDNWEKFNETSLPDKESFYRN